ncbi:MAG TPA: magnesium transporter [Planctomycetota bacterium]|nr:magnesium transporter [Planctomycetota bacterium]
MTPAEDPPDEDRLTLADARDGWALFDETERLDAFHSLPRPEAEDFFLDLPSADQAHLVIVMPAAERRSWLRLLAPDDAADLMQEVPAEQRASLVALLDEVTQKDVSALLAFAEDDAGGLMDPRYARLRPDMNVDEAITYLRRVARDRPGLLYYAYALDAENHLLGVVSFRQLFRSPSDRYVRDVMTTDIVKADETLDQEALGRLFQRHDLLAIPVVDAQNRMKGVVTVDDIVDVVQEEATEDIQKIGGTEALDAPYLQTSLKSMVRKRAGWLAVLFLGETLTASAMGHFEDELARALVLSLFIPLIISSGGNSGSQATTLVIRAMALGEVRLKDWWHVVRREIAAGLALGGILGVVGFLRVGLWHAFSPGIYGAHWAGIAVTVAIAVVGVVTWGTIAGSMLPFVLKRLGLDPASASAPFVATLVDVSGLVIYFSAASLILSGTLL